MPEYQRQGIGTALIEEGLSQLKDLKVAGCCVLGHPDYYKKFGFKNVLALTIEGVPPVVLFSIAFGGASPHGLVTFHEGFKADAQQST